MNDANRPIVFAMDGATEIANGIETWIQQNWIEGFQLTPKEEWRRHDREQYALSKANVRGRKVYIIQSFTTDNVLAAWDPTRVTRFRVKLKAGGSVIPDTIPINSVGSAWWDNGNVCVRFDREKRVIELPFTEFSHCCHILGETVDEKIWGTILFAHSLRTASCGEITLIGTMLPYMRQDEKDQPRAPIDTAAFAIQMKAAGVNRIITIDVHSKGGMQNCCAGAGIGFDHLESRHFLAEEAIKGIPDKARVVVVAPDIGSSKRSAPKFQATVSRLLNREVGFAIVRKVRMGDTKSELTTLIEDPRYPIGPRDQHGCEDGAYVLSPDDILATGGTLRDVANEVRARGGIFHAACCTHGLYTGNAAENLKDITKLVSTKTVDPWRIEGTTVYDRIVFVDVSSIFAQAIRETHTNGSINNILQNL